MKRIWTIVLLLSLGLNVGLGLNLLRPRQSAPAAPAPHGFHAGSHDPGDSEGPDRAERYLRRRLDRMDKHLHLTDSQRDGLWNLHLETGAGVFDRRRGLEEARSHLHEVSMQEDVDPAEIRRVTRRLGVLQSELDSVVVGIMLREREILTVEQRREYRSLFPMGRKQRDRFPQGLNEGRRSGHREAQ